jgi:hypothetical protein
MGHKAGIGAIFGVVSEEGVAKPNSPVILLDRENKKIVRRQLTREDGGFTFNGLNENEATYMAIATDEDGGVPKNALIQDRILPVPAYSGATFWGNWPYLARRDGALVVWSGAYLESGGQIRPFDSQTAGRTGEAPVRLLGAGTVGISAVEPAVGAPQIPVLALTNMRITMPGYVTRDVGTSQSQSLEVVVALDSVSGAVSFAGFPGRYEWGERWNSWWYENGSTSAGCHVPNAKLTYTVATRTLSVWFKEGTGGSKDGTWGGGPDGGTARTYSFVFPVGEVPSGLVHLAFSLVPGIRLALFVNGAIVQEWDLSGQSLSLQQANGAGGYGDSARKWGIGGFLLAGAAAGTVAPGITYADIGPFAYYPHVALSDADIATHYEALMATSLLPLLTGYVKEVMMDSPVFYARLDDLQGDVTAEDFFQREFMRYNYYQRTDRDFRLLGFKQYPPTSISLEAPSPVLGGMATVFDGGYLRADTMVVSPATREQLSFEFFINPPETVVGTSPVVRLANSTTAMAQVSLTSTRSFSLLLRLNNATNETLTFTHSIPFDVDSHVVITLDKAAREAVLYVNGVPQETLDSNSINSILLLDTGLIAANSAVTTWLYYTFIAGDGTSVFRGKLCEVAFYHQVLSPARVLSHYNARLIP